METLYEVNVVFGEHKARTMATDSFSAAITAVGQVWSAHTISELDRGYIASMPCVSSFDSLDTLQAFIDTVLADQDEDEVPWLVMTIQEHHY